MGTGYPPHDKQDRLDESQHRRDEFSDTVLPMLEDVGFEGDELSPHGDECADDVLSLLEENARLRGLVVKLSNLVLRSIVDRR